MPVRPTLDRLLRLVGLVLVLARFALQLAAWRIAKVAGSPSTTKDAGELYWYHQFTQRLSEKGEREGESLATILLVLAAAKPQPAQEADSWVTRVPDPKGTPIWYPAPKPLLFRQALRRLLIDTIRK